LSVSRHLERRVAAWQLADRVLVVCPACSARAVLLQPVGSAEASQGGPRVRCSSCGLARAVDPFAAGEPSSAPACRGLPLWLTAPCCGRTLWAYNLRHVEIIEEIVAARLRERRRDPQLGWSNSSVASRLPRWVLAARHRRAALRALKRLRALAL